MRLPPLTVVVVLAMSVPVHPVTAQSRRAPTPAGTPTRDSVVDIPESMMPPAGKCRIWMHNVPAKQQPAATDCTTAMRQKPANAVLVFGPAQRDLSPFEVRQLWQPRPGARDAERSMSVNGDVARFRTENGDTAAQRATSREAESRQAAPQKAEKRPTTPAKTAPAKTAPSKAERRPTSPRKPAPKKPEKP